MDIQTVDIQTVVLVEGVSDQHAVEALARRRGRDLSAEGVSVVPMGGATNIARFLERFGPRGLGVRVAGLCDVREEPAFRRGLERAGLGSDLTRAGMEALGFYTCVEDLEDELIRALGVPAMEHVIGTMGNLGSWQTFQKQPAQQNKPIERQLRRFLGTTSGRKIRYAPILVEALDLSEIPRPLDALLAGL